LSTGRARVDARAGEQAPPRVRRHDAIHVRLVGGQDHRRAVDVIEPFEESPVDGFSVILGADYEPRLGGMMQIASSLRV
jgi:hypothetical protein